MKLLSKLFLLIAVLSAVMLLHVQQIGVFHNVYTFLLIVSLLFLNMATDTLSSPPEERKLQPNATAIIICMLVGAGVSFYTDISGWWYIGIGLAAILVGWLISLITKNIDHLDYGAGILYFVSIIGTGAAIGWLVEVSIQSHSYYLPIPYIAFALSVITAALASPEQEQPAPS